MKRWTWGDWLLLALAALILGVALLIMHNSIRAYLLSGHRLHRPRQQQKEFLKQQEAPEQFATAPNRLHPFEVVWDTRLLPCVPAPRHGGPPTVNRTHFKDDWQQEPSVTLDDHLSPDNRE